MNYQVIWSRDAENDLASIWMSAADRSQISAAAQHLDESLVTSPLEVGESREGEIRIAFSAPLAIEYIANKEGKSVTVIAVWVFRI